MNLGKSKNNSNLVKNIYDLVWQHS